MKRTFLIAGAAALAFTAAPAAAKPGHGNGHGNAGHHQSYASNNYYGYGAGNCPPGLRKKNNGCMPPGQIRKLYRTGQRFPSSYGNLWSYNQLPYALRQRYDLDRSNRYYYGDGYLYQVDPRTRLIEQVVSALLR